jgi:hypothetical protein
MKGTAHKLINDFITQQARGNKIAEQGIRTQFILKGINVINLTPTTKDDPVLIRKVTEVIAQLKRQ